MEQAVFTSPKPPWAAGVDLENAISNASFERSSALRWCYGGRPRDGRFCIRYVSWFGNAFARPLYGTITPHGDGAEIRVELRLPLFHRVFLTFWFGVIGLAAAILTPYGIWEFFASSSPAPPPLTPGGRLFMKLLPLGMLLFGYLLMSFGRLLSRAGDEALMSLMRQVFVENPHVEDNSSSRGTTN
jgi:hypothetical protein